MATPKLDKSKIDVSQAFLIFMATMGDCERTAIAIDLEPEQVKALAESEGWAEKVRRVSVMSKSGKPGDWERAQNRAISFVQAVCLRDTVNRLLHEVSGMTNEELVNRACVRTRDGGSQLSAKFLVDLANAAEASHRMAYMALNDTVTERADRENGSGSSSSCNDLHSAIVASLSNPSASPLTTTQVLITEASEEVQRLASAKALDLEPVEAKPAE